MTVLGLIGVVSVILEAKPLCNRSLNKTTLKIGSFRCRDGLWSFRSKKSSLRLFSYFYLLGDLLLIKIILYQHRLQGFIELSLPLGHRSIFFHKILSFHNFYFWPKFGSLSFITCNFSLKVVRVKFPLIYELIFRDSSWNHAQNNR